MMVNILSYNIKINPVTNQPNFTMLGVNRDPAKGSYEADFCYPLSAQRTSWTGLTFTSGNINFSGTNTKMNIIGGGPFDFDKNSQL
jgi:hypothetical protein